MVTALLLALVAAAPAAGPTVRDIVEVTDLSGLAASPDGRWVAFRTEQPSIAANGYRIAWYIVAADGRSAPRRIGDGGGALYNGAGALQTELPVWSPRSDGFYARALVGGAVQIHFYPLRGAARPVTHDPANVRDIALAPDGRALVYHVGATRQALAAAEDRADADGVRVDASVDMAQPLVRGVWRDGQLASERLSGRWFTHGDLLWHTPVRTVRLPFAARLPSRHEPVAAGPSVDLAYADGRWVLAAIGPNKTRTPCTLPACLRDTPVSAVPTGEGRALLVTTQDRAQAQTLTWWDPVSGASRTLLRSDGLINGGREPETPCAAAGGQAICVAAAATRPPHLVHVDLLTGRETILLEPNRRLGDLIGTTAQRVEWTSPLGTAFAGQLILPRSPRPTTGVPLVISYYDCPGFLRGGLGDELPMLPLARAGIGVLCINKAHNPQAVRAANWDYDQARAGITAIIDRLATQSLVDRRRVGMWGLSFGSEIVMMMAREPNLLAAAAIATGQLEPAFYWTNAVAGRDAPDLMRETWGVGDPERDPAGWKRLSPALNADQIRVPLLMQMPEQEARWSMELLSKLSRSPVPTEMFAFAHEAHQKEQPRHKASAYARNLDWFRFWLRGAVDPDPAKADQYRRWTSMAERWRAAAPLDRAHP